MPELEDVAPAIPTYVPKRNHSLLPIIFGFLIIILIVAAVAITYYQTILFPGASPSPSPTIIASPTPEPSLAPSSTPSASPKSSIKPVSAIKTNSSSPIPTAPTLDVRFGNPSANVKQTIDEGLGDGRVINREYTSIQAGQFDEVASNWSPRVTVCYHIVSNETVSGKDIKFSLSLDDKIEVEDSLGGYDKLEAGRTYDWCHDVTSSIGKHTAKLLLNPSKSIKEANYTNDLARVDWENLPDKIAPNYVLLGPSNEDSDGTCFIASYLNDNVTLVTNLKYEIKQDGGNWQTILSDKYCLRGDSGSPHSLSFRISDARGNINEQNKTYVLYWT